MPATVAVIPVKDLSLAKTRLAATLTAGQRRDLALAMLGDVLESLMATPGLDRVMVVSRDPAVLKAGCAAGAAVFAESASDLNGALAEAAAALGPRTDLLVVPGDVPLVQPADVSELLRPGPRPGSAVVRTRDGGTGALLLRPPSAFPFRFGPNSFRLHLLAAREAGVPIRVCQAPGFAFDVDQAQDLQRVAAFVPRRRSGKLLVRLWALGAGIL